MCRDIKYVYIAMLTMAIVCKSWILPCCNVYVFLQLCDKVTMLKPKKKSIYEAFILEKSGCIWVLASYDSCYVVVAYICSVKIVLC